MRRMRLGDAAIGFALAEAPADAGGRPLMPRGAALDEEAVEKLRQAGVQSVLVEDPAFADAVFTSVVSAPTQRIAAAVFHEVKERLRTRPQEPLPQTVFLRLAHAVTQDALETPLDAAALLQPANLAQGDEVYAVNRAALGVHLCSALRLPRYAHDVVSAGLVCDLGMLLLPDGLRWKPEPLTTEERETVRGHVAGTMRLIASREGWSAVMRTAVHQHHERMDGGGYPEGLRGDAVHITARILAVCDVYSAMLIAGPDREGPSPEEALAEIDGSAGSGLDFDVVAAFHRIVPPFPVGTEVELSTGERAVVLRVPPQLKARPVVRVFTDRGGSRLPQCRDLDLSERGQQAKTVVRVIA